MNVPAHETDTEATGLPAYHPGRAREAAAMVLYVSILLLAALVAMPDDYGTDLHLMLAIIWGTTAGTALAHAFAFQVVALGIASGRFRADDAKEIGLQVAAAMGVALLSTLVLVIVPGSKDVRWAAFVPAVMIGVGGYYAARARTGSRLLALAGTFVILAAGLGLAVFKAVVLAH